MYAAPAAARLSVLAGGLSVLLFTGVVYPTPLPLIWLPCRLRAPQIVAGRARAWGQQTGEHLSVEARANACAFVLQAGWPP